MDHRVAPVQKVLVRLKRCLCRIAMEPTTKRWSKGTIHGWWFLFCWCGTPRAVRRFCLWRCALADYNNSPIWNKAILGQLPLLTIVIYLVLHECNVCSTDEPHKELTGKWCRRQSLANVSVGVSQNCGAKKKLLSHTLNHYFFIAGMSLHG